MTLFSDFSISIFESIPDIYKQYVQCRSERLYYVSPGDAWFGGSSVLYYGLALVELVRSEGGSLPLRRNFAWKGSAPTHHFWRGQLTGWTQPLSRQTRPWTRDAIEAWPEPSSKLLCFVFASLCFWDAIKSFSLSVVHTSRSKFAVSLSVCSETTHSVTHSQTVAYTVTLSCSFRAYPAFSIAHIFAPPTVIKWTN